jgi:hypothetical protein
MTDNETAGTEDELNVRLKNIDRRFSLSLSLPVSVFSLSLSLSLSLCLIFFNIKSKNVA